ncbi:hypothetical protein BCV70DRAFT_199138 [Testicularia cyperi]|uniref:P-loop containing nucleoside triphosphate hydrolase protein n=1 Tax=Testicularia cyperi TaxID=1882483 RepID=A0A317XUH8_9BASI|nr:hypothetical protein BCV70DRAFT_199138 [Testicularia cyperi]
MSVSPFLPGNSIWSNSTPLSGSQSDQLQHQPAGDASAAGAGIDAGVSSQHPPQTTSQRNDAGRLAAHPLPNKPSAPVRSNSSLSSRTAASEDQNRSFDSVHSNASGAQRLAAIGAQRSTPRHAQQQLQQSQQQHPGYNGVELSRSNSLATSFQSFRSASTGSSLPGLGATDSTPSRPSLQGRPSNMAGPASLSLRSPSLGGTPSHLERDLSQIGETEFGTPRLMLDSQHVFGSSEHAHSFGRSVSASMASGSSTSKPRPNSWMHPSATDKAAESLLSPTMNTSDSVFRRPASSQGDRTESLPVHSSLGSNGGNAGAGVNGYPFPTTMGPSLTTAPKRLSAQFTASAAETMTSSPIDGGDLLNANNLFALQQAAAARSTSPALPSSANELGYDSGRGTPSLSVPSYMNLSGGLLSPTAATIGSKAPSVAPSRYGSPMASGSFAAQQKSVSAGHLPDDVAEDPVASYSQIKDLAERLLRVESGMKDFSRQISGISRNVSLLLERTKGLPPSSLAAAGNHQVISTPAMGSSVANGDELRSLNAQISALTNSVSHLLTLQGNGIGASGGVPQSPLTGLGIGASTAIMGTPQLGMSTSGIERSASPRVGSVSNGQFASHPSSFVPQTAISPRPNGNGRGWSGSNTKTIDTPGDRRWSAATPAGLRKDSSTAVGGRTGLGVGPSGSTTPSFEEMGATNGLAPGQIGTGFTALNAIISKWDHLNLHPDLLRSILKYGLGPPNKIQQRALPFLLRGSDIIAQAPPTQERIASYVIPALQLVLNVARESGGMQGSPARGPIALIVSTTVDQATQAQRMALGLGAPVGIRVHIVAAGSIDVQQEVETLMQTCPHIVVGTPQKMSDLFTYLTNHAANLKSARNTSLGNPGGIDLDPSEIRLVVLDEVDQLIARNLADHVSSMLRVLPPPSASSKTSGIHSPGLPPGTAGSIFSPFEQGSDTGNVRTPPSADRQIALFSNTVPQDVLNFAQSIHLRESVRVLVRRDGGSTAINNSNSTMSGNNHGGPGGAASVVHGAGSQVTIGPQHRDVSQPSNALGAHPVNSSVNAAKDPILSALKGLRQYYLYVAVTSSNGMGASSPMPGIGHNPAGEMKLDLISDLVEDIEFGQAVIYCANVVTQEALIYKLSSKGIEALGLNREINSYTRQQTLAKFRSPLSQFGTGTVLSSATFAAPGGFIGVQPGSRARKALVVCDMALNPKEVHQIPLIMFYDMPRSVEEYKDKISCAAAGSMARPSVCVNVVTASGGPRGDVEMLRTLECHLGCKMAELPMDPKQILNF